MSHRTASIPEQSAPARCPAHQQRLYLAGPEQAERFFAAPDEDLSHADGWDAVFGGRFGRGLLNLDGAPHLAYRQALMPLLRRTAVTDRQPAVAALIDGAADTLPAGPRVDLHAFTQPLAFRVAAHLFAGSDHAEAAELYALYGELRTPQAGELGTPGGNLAARRVGRARRRMREMLRTAVARADASEADGPVRRLRALSPPAPDDVIAENIAIMILAGYETTGYLSARLLWLLARHPQQQDAIRREDGDPASAPLLDAAFTETARLHPPLAWLPRRATRDLDLAGTAVHAGQEVFHSVTDTQRAPELFAEPHEFRPERFTGGERHARLALTPFGAGRRICAGIHLGTLETKLIAATLLRRFHLHADGGPYVGDVSDNGSTVAPAAPLLARLVPLPG